MYSLRSVLASQGVTTGPDRRQVLFLLSDATTRQNDPCGLHSLGPTIRQPKLGLCTHMRFTRGGKGPGKVSKEGLRIVQNAFSPGEQGKGFPCPTPHPSSIGSVEWESP